MTPVIIGVTGTISKSLRQYLSIIPGKHGIKVLQKIAILGTAHVLREVLMLKYKTYFTDETTLRVAQIVDTEQLQNCVPYKHSLLYLHNCKYRG
jgi:hypothetical protein